MAIKQIPANPAGKPDMGPSKRPPMGMGKPMKSASNGGKGKPGTRKA